MKLIKELDIRPHKTGPNKVRWALFECPYCFGFFERRKGNGLRDRSCGCVRFYLIDKAKITHNATGDPLFSSWRAMHRRCLNPKDESFKYYGAKGISICEKWYYFYLFKEWALGNGWQKGLTIHRINNKGDYEPGNCEWLTRSEHAKKQHQAKNSLGQFKKGD